jgi:hypothetical protein
LVQLSRAEVADPALDLHEKGKIAEPSHKTTSQEATNDPLDVHAMGVIRLQMAGY